MSIDLSNYDIYNYDLYLRPDKQTLGAYTVAGNTIPASIGKGNLKKQFLNVPNGFVFNPNHKAYFYLKDIRIGARDSVDFLSDGLYAKQQYLKVKTGTQYTVLT